MIEYLYYRILHDRRAVVRDGVLGVYRILYDLEQEQVRPEGRKAAESINKCMCVCVYIYIYREREIDTDIDMDMDIDIDIDIDIGYVHAVGGLPGPVPGVWAWVPGAGWGFDAKGLRILNPKS